MNRRGFKVVGDSFKKIPNVMTILPLHGSENSAGYDFYSKDTVELSPGEKFKFMTDIKAYMLEDEYLSITIRSSMGIKKGMRLTNQYGVIDSDYYENPDNDGNITIELENLTGYVQKINVGDRICQGIFKKYLKADPDSYTIPVDYVRKGGIGHTGVQ